MYAPWSRIEYDFIALEKEYSEELRWVTSIGKGSVITAVFTLALENLPRLILFINSSM
ncbi:hypothetical protein CK203_099983 [Vitis vinifera]|uniref:Uncharacterized protein n=1 Tax=Vitis vinifera TaxID=29760 RepID=A0A438DI94_VITVI|nr:hypothetical protein CK203_099983 [Vitis vinifera]